MPTRRQQHAALGPPNKAPPAVCCRKTAGSANAKGFCRYCAYMTGDRRCDVKTARDRGGEHRQQPRSGGDRDGRPGSDAAGRIADIDCTRQRTRAPESPARPPARGNPPVPTRPEVPPVLAPLVRPAAPARPSARRGLYSSGNGTGRTVCSGRARATGRCTGQADGSGSGTVRAMGSGTCQTNDSGSGTG